MQYGIWSFIDLPWQFCPSDEVTCAEGVSRLVAHLYTVCCIHPVQLFCQSCYICYSKHGVLVTKSCYVIPFPDSQVHGANMGPIWGRQDTGGPHVGPMNFAIWVCWGSLALWGGGVSRAHSIYCQICNISHTKSQTLNVPCLVLQLSLLDPLMSGIEWRMKM